MQSFGTVLRSCSSFLSCMLCVSGEDLVKLLAIWQQIVLGLSQGYGSTVLLLFAAPRVLNGCHLLLHERLFSVRQLSCSPRGEQQCVEARISVNVINVRVHIKVPSGAWVIPLSTIYSWNLLIIVCRPLSKAVVFKWRVAKAAHTVPIFFTEVYSAWMWMHASNLSCC